MITKRPTILIILIATLVPVGQAAAPAALGAGATPADKQAFMGRQVMYLSFEITETGRREFGAGTPKDAITDGAHRINRSVKFEVPLDMAMPGSFPPSSMPMTPTEMTEQGRFIGWMAVPPDDPAVLEQITTGKIDLARNGMFLPVEFSIDDVQQFRYRDSPTEGWGTNTTTSKGRGIAYIARSGMLLCDMMKMTCDINNVLMDYQEATDLITVATASDVPGFEAKRETVGPGLLLPKISDSMAKQLVGFTITLPEPFTMTLSGPPSAGAQVGESAGSGVTMKVTLSSKPAANYFLKSETQLKTTVSGAVVVSPTSVFTRKRCPSAETS
ncbi:MAG TPA: hypothetical protein VGK94_13495 [Candidatus Polarisedimenticolia bacterium]|jgi:hypothetical protein